MALAGLRTVLLGSTFDFISRPLAAFALVVTVQGCALPRRPAELPPPSQGYVAVLSGEMPAAISQVSRHSWIVANDPGEPGLHRFDMAGSEGDPFAYFGRGDVALHGVVRFPADAMPGVLRCLDAAESRYYREHPDYFPIPGPNSNTMVDLMLRACKIHVELPATAIGRDYRGVFGASVTSRGTGVQLETWLVGLKLGLEEGVEVHLLDMPFGVHFWPPGITVPVNPGRIGIDDSTHRDPAPPRYEAPWDRPRVYGLASLWLGARYARVIDPGGAGGLSDLGGVAFETRGAFGETLGYAVGADLEAGAGAPLAFAYAARLYPVGAAWMFGDNTFVGAFAGVGSDGVPGSVAAALALPAELRAEIDVTPSVRAGVKAAAEWFPATQARRGGAVLGPAVDGFAAAGFVRIGRAPRCGCPGDLGRGYFFAVERREVMRTAWLALTFGVEADFGG